METDCNRVNLQKKGLFSVSWSSTDAQTPDFISREEAWKLYIQKLQDEANYLLNSPDGADICCCKDCIVSSRRVLTESQ